MNSAQALAHLQAILAGQTFAPQRPAAPIQIMSYLESTGLAFTHLWVGGLQDVSWPSAPNINPFLPLPAQRNAGIPRIDHAGELAFAQRRLAHWQAASEEFVVSHVNEIDEAQHGPSPLIAQWPLTQWEALLDEPRHWSHPAFAEASGALETLTDVSGSTQPAGPQRGGTTLLRDQALCPFRAWAVHRLGLREERAPRAFPDALDRGILVHDALHLLLGGATPRNHTQISDADIDRAVAAALGNHFAPYPEPFVEHERNRLAQLLHAWRQVDMQRSNVSIEGLEVSETIELAGLRLQIRLDRVDRAPEGLTVIDYKTGRVSSRRLLGDRLVEPQLAAYAVYQSDVRCVLFAQLDAAKPRLVGFSTDPAQEPQMRAEALPEGGWPAIVERWRGQLTELAQEFRQGHAAVAPAPEACERCHLHSLCRIRDEGLSA